MNPILGVILNAVRIRRFGLLGVAALLALLLSGITTKAGCAVPFKAGAAPAIPFANPHEDDEEHGRRTIVGMWHVLYTGESDTNFPPGGPFPPTPFRFLESFKTWHADGTEFENAFLPPVAGNICFGVWKDLSEHRVKLHHIGLMFGADGSISAIFTVDEVDTVGSDGKTYTGTFDFKLWPPSYDAVGVGTPISEVNGSVAATRITVD
jgi:hypothetical protein